MVSVLCIVSFFMRYVEEVTGKTTANFRNYLKLTNVE